MPLPSKPIPAVAIGATAPNVAHIAVPLHGAFPCAKSNPNHSLAPVNAPLITGAAYLVAVGNAPDTFSPNCVRNLDFAIGSRTLPIPPQTTEPPIIFTNHFQAAKLAHSVSAYGSNVHLE